MVVVDPPVLDLLLGVFERQEPVDVQAFVTERAVKRLNEGVVGGLAGTGEVHRDAMLVGHLSKALLMNSLPLSVWSCLGTP